MPALFSVFQGPELYSEEENADTYMILQVLSLLLPRHEDRGEYLRSVGQTTQEIIIVLVL